MCEGFSRYKNKVTKITVAKKLCPHYFKMGHTPFPWVEDCISQSEPRALFYNSDPIRPGNDFLGSNIVVLKKPCFLDSALGEKKRITASGLAGMGSVVEP